MKNLVIILLLIFSTFRIGLLAQELNPKSNWYEEMKQQEKRLIGLLESGDSSELKALKNLQRERYFYEGRADQNGSFENYFSNLEKAYEKTDVPVYESDWTFLGPKGFPQRFGGGYAPDIGKGRVNCIWIDPDDHNIIYAGSGNGGLWLTENGGNSWRCLTSFNYKANSGIEDVLVNENGYIYILSRFQPSYGHYSYGILYSTDGGNTWYEVQTFNGVSGDFYPSSDFSRLPRRIIMDPADNSRMYFLTEDYVFGSTDYGMSWNLIFYQQSSNFTDIKWFKDGAHSYLYISGKNNCYVGYDDANFVSLKNTIMQLIDYAWYYDHPNWDLDQTAFHNITFEQSPLYPDKLWVLCCVNYEDIITGLKTNISIILKSNYARTTSPSFYILSNSLIPITSGGTCFEIKVSTLDENKLFCGGVYLYVWDNGIPAERISTSGGGYNNVNWVHVDIRDILVLNNSSTDETIFTGDDAGVTKSTAMKPTGELYEWHNISDDGTDGLYISQFYDIEGSENNPDFLTGGCLDIASFLYDDAGWHHIGSGDGGKTAVDYDTYSKIYYLKYIWLSSMDIITHTDDMEGWAEFLTIGTENYQLTHPFIMCLELHPTDPSILYYGWQKLVMVNNVNNLISRQNPVNITPDAAFLEVKALGLSKADPNRIYAAFSTQWSELYPPPITSGALFRGHRDPSTSDVVWDEDLTEVITNSTSVFPSNILQYAFIQSIEVNSENANEIWIGFADNLNTDCSVYYSNNAGESWIALSENYPAYVPVNDLEYDPDARILYMANDAGIYFYDMVSKSWYDFNDCFPEGIVSSLTLNRSAGLIRASTFGFGIWEANLAFCTTVPNIPLISGTASEDCRYQAIDYINSTQNTASKNIQYEAGSVNLQPPFTGYPGFNARSIFYSSCNNMECEDFLKIIFREPSKSKSFNDQEDITADQSPEIEIFPNPANNQIIVEYSVLPEGEIRIYLWNTEGKLVKRDVIHSNEYVMDVSDLNPGIYVLQIEYGEVKISENIVVK